MKRILPGCAMVFVCISLYGQTSGPASKIWTLKECVDYALANNLDVQRSQYNVESSEINYLQAKMAMLPSLNASVSNGYNWGRSINPVTNEFTTRQINTLGPSAQSSVTLFNGLRVQNTIKQNSKDYQASTLDLEKTRNDVSLNVINLYINVIFNKELLENARFQLVSTQQQLDRTKKQVAAGALPKSDELNLDAQVATNEMNVVNNENALNLSMLQLKQALQLPASVPMEIETPALNVEDFVLDQSSDQVFDIARQSMPEVRSAELKKRSSFYAMKAAKGNLYPRLSLSGFLQSNYSSANASIFQPDSYDVTPTQIPIGYFSDQSTGNTVPVLGYDYSPSRSGRYVEGPGYQDQLSDNFYRSVSLTLSIPVFNGLQSKSAVKRAIVNQQLAEISSKQINQTLRQNVESAYNDAIAASKSYNSALRQVQAREEAFRATKQRYDLGATNYVEYQVSENDLFRAKSDLSRAKYNFIFRKKLLDFYQGKPLEF